LGVSMLSSRESHGLGVVASAVPAMMSAISRAAHGSLPRQSGTGKHVVFTRDLVERTGYLFPPRCTSDSAVWRFQVPAAHRLARGRCVPRLDPPRPAPRHLAARCRWD